MADVPSSYRALEASHRSPRAGATRTGAADPMAVLSVSVRIRRRLDAPALPDPADLAMTPHRERRYLSREDFASHHGASAEDVAAEHRLSVVEASVARRTVVLKGTVGQFGGAFAVDLGIYETADETYRGREGALHVPAELAGVVEGVFGLDDRRMAEPHIRWSGTALASQAPRAAQAARSPAQGAVPLTPPQVAQLYGFPTAPSAAGQTIGIFEFGGGYKPSDVQLFCSSVNAPMPSIASVGILGQTNAPGSDGYTLETLLDLGVTASVARGAKLAVYFAPWTEQGWVDAVTTAIHDPVNKPSVISISYGWPENDGFGALTWSLAAIQAVNATFQEAAALGVTIFVSSGDTGSGSGVGDGRAHVNYPGSDPYVTCVGGTSISNVSGLSFKEDVWNDGSGATGGGISDIFKPPGFALPAWQSRAGVPGSVDDGHAGRGIPDIAGNADQSSGYQLFMNGADVGAVGGTSAAAPLYAALAALLNAQLGEPVGYLNPSLYAMPAGYVFRDVADEISNADGAPGYKAGLGWDACTGLGGVNGAALGHALQGLGLPVAVETFGAALHMVWKGAERDDRVFHASFDGAVWGPQRQVPGIASSAGAALAAFQGRLFAAWKGLLGDQRIFWSSFDGTGWSAQQVVPGVGSSVGPRVAVLGSKLFMAWKGVEGDQRMFFSRFDGAAWSPQQLVVNAATSVGPAVAVFDGALHMAWKGENGDQRLFWSRFDGAAFAPQQAIANTGSSEGPSLAAFGGRLHAVWKGEFGDRRMWHSTFDGTAWAPQKQVPGVASSVSPGLAVYAGKLFATWKGELGDQSIWWSSFDGASWAAQRRVPGVATSPDLVMAA